MADLNVGAIKASLSVDAQAWLQGLSNATKGLQAWESGVGRTFDQFNSRLSKNMATAKAHLTAFGAAVGASLGGAVVVFREFDKAAREVNSIMRLSEKEAGTYRGQIRQLTRDLGINVTATEAMRAAYSVASAGFTSAAEQQKVLTAGLKLAKAGVADTATTLNALTGALRAYGKGADEAADFADVLFKTVELGQTTLPELAQTLSRATLTASTAGVSFDQLGSAIAALTLKGVPTATALDALNQAMIQMLSPSTQAEKALQSVGLTATSLGETLRAEGLRGAIVKLFSATRGDVSALKKILGDVNAVKAVLALGAGGGQEFGRAEAAMAERGGAAARGAAEISKSLSEQIGITTSLLRDLALSVGEALMPVLLRVNDAIRVVVEALARIPEPVKQSIAQFLAAAAATSLLLAGLTQLLPIGLNLVKMLAAGGLTAQMGAFAAGLKVAAGAIGIVLAALAKFAAVLAVVGAAVAINLGGIRDTVAATFGFIAAEVGSTVAEIGEALADLGNAIGVDMATIVNLFRGFGVDALGLLSEAMRLILAVVQVAVTSMVAAFRGLFILVQAAVRIGAPILASLFRGLASTLSGIWELLTLAMQGRWDDLWEALKSGIARAAVSLRAAVARLMEGLINEVAAMVSRFEVLGFRMFESLGNGMRRGAAATQRIIAGGATGGVQGALQAGASGGAGAGLLDRLMGFLKAPGAPGKAPEKSPGQKAIEDAAARLKELTTAQAAPAGTHPAGPATARAGGMSPAEMRAFIRRQADVTGNIEGLTQEALSATFRLVENAMKAGIRLGITSGKRFGSGRSLHDIGQAVDITIPGEGPGSTRAGAIASQLAQGTGFRSGINEYLQEAMRITGATGPHVHMAMREDGRGVPGFFKVAGSTATALEKVRENLDEFAAELARAGLRLLSPEQRARAEVEERYAGLTQRGLEAGAGPEMMGRIAQLRRQELAQLAAEEQAKALQEVQATAAEEQRLLEDRRRARADAAAEERRERFATFEHSRALGQQTLADQILFFEQELEARTLQKDQRRSMELELLDLYRQDLAARLTDQATYNEQWLTAERNRLLQMDQANTEVQLRMIAVEQTLQAVREGAQAKQAEGLSFLQGQFQLFFSNVISGQQSMADAFKSLWSSISKHVIDQIAKMITETKLFKSIMSGLETVTGGILGFVGKLFGFHGGGTVGAPGQGQAVPSFHTGGMVSKGAMRPSSGLRVRSDEVLAKLQTGEMVLSRDQVRGLTQSPAGGAGVTVYVSPSMVQEVNPDQLGRVIGRDIMWRMQGAI